MRTLVTLLCSATLLLTSCGGEEKTPDSTTKDSVVVSSPKYKFDTQKFIGKYVGPFGKSTVILSINYISGKNASGNNILRGQKRNIKGTIEEKEGVFNFVLKEPGGEKYDGVFEFSVDTTTFDLTGKWTPNNPEETDAKEFTLKKTEKKEADTELMGDWYGNIGELNGTLTMKKNGTCAFNAYIWDEMNEKDENVSLKGTWIEDEKYMNLELENHRLLKYSKLKLKKNKSSDEGKSMTDGEKASFHEMYWY